MDEKISQTEDNRKKNIRFRTERCQVCGSLVMRLNRSRHCKTRKHKDANYVMHEQFWMQPAKKQSQETIYSKHVSHPG